MSATRHPARPLRLAVALVCLAATTMAQAPREIPGQLHITSDPDDAAVTLNGEQRGVTPLTLSNVAPGKYLMILTRRQHRSERRTLEVTPGSRTSHHITLEPLHGLLLVHTRPQRADVQVNGVDRGASPLLLADLPLGEHRIRVSSPNYIAKEVAVSLRDRIPQKVEIELTPDFGTLAVASTPTGARLQVNGVSQGTTPAEIERVPTGSATIELQMDGHEPFRESIRITAGEHQNINAVLKPIPATLQIVTMPESARVYVNNQFQGPAPVRMEGLDPGRYRVRIELEAFDPMARDVTLALASSVVEEFRLTSNSGALDISTEPALVKVFIDGSEMGTTPIADGQTDRVSSESLRIDRIPVGSRELQLVRPGYRTRTETVDIVRDQTLTGHYALERIFIPNFEIITATEVYRGVLQEIDANGNIRIELRPGILKTVRREEIRERRPLRAIDPEAAARPEADAAGQ